MLNLVILTMLNGFITIWGVYITSLGNYYKERHFYRNVVQLLQIGASIITTQGSFASLKNGARANPK